MKYAFVRDHRTEFPVAAMCRVLRVSRSGFYGWMVQGAGQPSHEDLRLVVKIKEIHARSRKTYGSPRVTQALRTEEQINVNHKRVERLMRIHGIRAVHRRRYRVTTDSKHDRPVAANILNRDFDVEAADRVWLADITYIRTYQGWLYMAAILDLSSRRIVGWSLEPHMREDLVLEALEMALGDRRPGIGLLLHSDQGSQYAADDYQARLEGAGIVCSMSRKGNCWDNAVMESFFHTLKVECVYQTRYHTFAEARRDIFEYIEGFYNTHRMHSSLGYLSPADYEAAQVRQVA